jgi:hypothetical protein
MADNISNSYFKMNIQKKNSDGTWTTVGTKTSRYENLEITKNAGTMYFKFDQNNVMANGDYRVQIVLDKSIFKDVFKQTSGDPLNWTSVASSEATDVVVGDYIYFNVNKQ